MPTSKHVLPIIVIAQFFCTSLWFAGNSVSEQLIQAYNLSEQSIGHLTSSVQFGFILGTLIFAILTIVDRFSPSLVFLFCGISGAVVNMLLIWEGGSFLTLISSRFLTGLFLAGIYPVGMKIATDYFKEGLGKSLGYLVGAVVLGTALPHLLKDLFTEISWKYVILGTSSLSIIGGLLVYLFVQDGPYRKPSLKLKLSTFLSVFKNSNFRAAAFGYFGHMWELYAFWTFIPLIILNFNKTNTLELRISLFSCLIIGIGGISCVIAGYLAHKFGTKKIALIALSTSGICCLLSPLFLTTESSLILLIFLFVWGFMVVADSPLFSTLVAQNTEPQTKGTALIIVTCIGYATTILSIQLLTFICFNFDIKYLFIILSLGPAIGVYSLLRNRDLN